MSDIQIDGTGLAAGFVSGAVAFLAWVIRVAAREALAGLKQSIDNHAHTLTVLALEIKEMRQEVSDIKSRVVAVETRQRP